MTIWLQDKNAGPVPNADFILGVGQNPNVETGVALPEDIWGGGGIYPWLTGATAIEIVSTSASDSAAGTGMRTIQIDALDINYAPISFTVTLNGLTPVAFPQNIFRLNRAIIATAGSNGTNVGDITIRNTGGGTTRDIIYAGYGVARSSAYTVPAGKTLLLTSLVMSINRPSTVRDCTLALMVRNSSGAFYLANEVSVDGNPFYRELSPAAPVPATTDIVFRCPFVSQTNTNISAGFGGILLSN